MNSNKYKPTRPVENTPKVVLGGAYIPKQRNDWPYSPGRKITRPVDKVVNWALFIGFVAAIAAALWS